MWEEVKMKSIWNSSTAYMPHTLFPPDTSSSCLPRDRDVELCVICLVQQLGLWNTPAPYPSGINNRWLLLNCAPAINQALHLTNCFKFLTPKLQKSCNLSVCSLDSPVSIITEPVFLPLSPRITFLQYICRKGAVSHLQSLSRLQPLPLLSSDPKCHTQPGSL